MVLFNRFIGDLPSVLKLFRPLLKFFYHRMMFRFGIDLPLDLKFGSNLRIYHFGGVVINSKSIIGDNVSIMHDVTIGNNMISENAPTISDGCFVGVGSKIIGGIFLAKKIKVGANAVVVKSCYIEGATLVGVPAHEVSGNSKTKG